MLSRSSINYMVWMGRGRAKKHNICSGSEPIKHRMNKINTKTASANPSFGKTKADQNTQGQIDKMKESLYGGK